MQQLVAPERVALIVRVLDAAVTTHYTANDVTTYLEPRAAAAVPVVRTANTANDVTTYLKPGR